jgi:sugar phosphate isomerase/epimerase
MKKTMRTTFLSLDQVLELGIFAKTFRRCSIDEVFDAIAGHGLTATQWNWACVPGFSSLPEGVPVEVTRTVARAAVSSGVRICAVSATFNLIEPAALEMGLSRLPALAAAAVAVGCDLLTLCTGTRDATDMWAYHPDNQSREAWAGMIEGLRQVNRIAGRYGVRLGVEPETANVVCDARSAELALQELGPEGKSISIILDAANLYRPPADPRLQYGIIDDAVERLGNYIRLAHAKDIAGPGATPGSSGATGHYEYVAAGAGILPYPHYVAALARAPAACAAAENGKRLPLLLHGLTEDEVPASVAFLREVIRTSNPGLGESCHAVLSKQ